MNNYEMLYIINNNLTDEQKEATLNKINDIVTKNGGNITKEDKWGTRKLAYEINKQRDGYYVYLEFEGNATLPEEINRNIKNMQDTYRAMILRR